MPQQLIKLNPSPPVQGKDVEICYDFANAGGITETTLRVSFTPNDGSTDYTVSSPNNMCVTVPVPPNGLQIMVEDLGGPSPDKVEPVTPS